MKVLILTEGSSDIGFGHITRCLSIYQAFKERGIYSKLLINGDSSVEVLLKNTEYEIVNWIEEKNNLKKYLPNAQIIFIDSYIAEKVDYEDIVKQAKLGVYYDDYNRLEYPCGIVVNGNLYGRKLKYPQKKCVKYLLGPQYLPLRRDFWEIPEKKIKAAIKEILITFGGDDIRNLTPKVLETLSRKFPKWKKRVVIGKGFKNLTEIKKNADKMTELIYYPDGNIMKKLMIECDIAISAGGQTLYELARIGLPTVVVLVAENQKENIKGMVEAGFIEYAGEWDSPILMKNITKKIKILENYLERKKRVMIGRNLVDGQGSKRIVKEILTQFINNYLVIRPVDDKDIWGVLTVSNDEIVRKNSFNSSFIKKKDHKEWFQKIDKQMFLVGELLGEIVAHGRVTKQDGEYVISIAVKKEFQNLGIGKKLLSKLITISKGKNLTAYVKKENLKSMKLFKLFDFKIINEGINYYKLLLEKDR